MGAKRHDIVEGPTCRSILAGTCDATAPHASLAQHLRRRQIRCFSYNLEALQAGGRGILAVQALLFVREALTSLLQFQKPSKRGRRRPRQAVGGSAPPPTPSQPATPSPPPACRPCRSPLRRPQAPPWCLPGSKQPRRCTGTGHKSCRHTTRKAHPHLYLGRPFKNT